MFIQTQPTPNPASLMFIPGQAVMESGSKSFGSAREAMASPLAKKLFAIDGVTQVTRGPRIRLLQGSGTRCACCRAILYALATASPCCKPGEDPCCQAPCPPPHPLLPALRSSTRTRFPPGRYSSAPTL